MLHAALATGIWALMFIFDVDVIRGKTWMVLALAWIVWVVAPIVSSRATRTRWLVTVMAGSLLLAPTIPTLYTFIVWGIEGFAP